MSIPVDARNVSVGTPKVGGAIFFAPLTKKAPLPTDASTAPDAKLVSLGYASSEGLKRAISKAYEKIKAWGGTEVKRPRTEITVDISFTLIESRRADVAKAVFGESAVTVTPRSATAGEKVAIAYKGEDGPEGTWVFDMQDGDGLLRIVIPRAAQTTESFEQTYTDNEAIAYPMNLTVYPDENGAYFFQYSDDGRKE